MTRTPLGLMIHSELANGVRFWLDAMHERAHHVINHRLERHGKRKSASDKSARLPLDCYVSIKFETCKHRPPL